MSVFKVLMIKYFFISLLILPQLLCAQQHLTANKKLVVASVEKHQQDLIKLSEQIPSSSPRL